MNDEPARYVRTRGGRMAHKHDCRVLDRVKYAHPWWWAAGKSDTDLQDEARYFGVQFCAVCFR